MPLPATSTPDDANTAPATAKRLRIPKRIQQAVALIASGEVKTQKAAAIRVGISEQHLCRMLQREQVQVFLRREAAKTIASAVPRASRRLVELVDASSEHVAAKVSERILTSEGILRSDQAQVSVNVDVRAGFVIDLSEPNTGKARADSPQAIDIEGDASPFNGAR